MHDRKNKTRVYRVLFGAAPVICAATLLCVSLSCKDTTTSITSLNDIVFPATNISYEKLVQPLFNIGCTIGTGCHNTQGQPPDLTSYGLWKLDPGVIMAGDTNNSRFVWCIEARPGSPLMPPARALSENQIHGLTRWVAEGAKDTQ